MNFDEIIVKESPGLCRCCLSEGCYKDLGKEHSWMGETEVYADILLECFDISISQHNEGPNGANRLICEVCITRLRDACNFKKQVQESEKKFVDMVGRGEFKPKVHIIYQPPLKAEEVEAEEAPGDADVEYLDEDIDFGDVDESVSRAAPARKRGRPRKGEPKPPRKLAKLVKAEEKTKSSKQMPKGRNGKKLDSQNHLARLAIIRHNILLILKYGNVTPFNWHTKGFRCFYCAKEIQDLNTLLHHTAQHRVKLDTFIPKKIVTKDIPVKVDVTDICCRACTDIPINSFEELVDHIINAHSENYDVTAGVCIFPFVLHKEVAKCLICDECFDNFMCLVEHMYKSHMEHSHMCQNCGLTFIDVTRLKRHMRRIHDSHKCTLCGNTFDTVSKLDKHKQRFHGQVRSYECSLCSETFENSYQVKVHMGRVHNVAKYMLKCEHCPKVCNTKNALLLHVQAIHPKVVYSCDECDYTTGIKWLVKLHKRKHSGDKQYSCSIKSCGKVFARSGILRTHMKIHTGNPGRVCRLCKVGHIDADSLEKHVAEVHYFDYY